MLFPSNKIAQKGFTLLEILVALSIIAIAMLSVIRLQSQTIAMSEAVKFYSVAPFLAQAKITDVLMDPQSYTGEASGDFGRELPGYSWQIEVIDSQFEPGDHAEISVAEIRVKINMEEDRAMQYTVSRYHPADEGELQR